MRLLIKLRATADCEWVTNCHPWIRGRIWDALSGTEYESMHDTHHPPGFSYGLPFPWGDVSEGETRHMLIASPIREIIGEIASDLDSNPELKLGTMPFEVVDMDVVDIDVGGAGSTGTLKTETGVLCKINSDIARDVYDIDTPDGSDEDVFWRPEHTMEPFRDSITQNLAYKHWLFESPGDLRDDVTVTSDVPNYQSQIVADGGEEVTDGDVLTGPIDVDYSLFESWDLQKTYSIPIEVTTKQEQTVVLSKWEFDYRVQDSHHRRILNLLLDLGIGSRNSLGLGFMNRVSD